jgi:hypothetical protein
MNKLLCLSCSILLISINLKAQRYIIIDRKLKQPMQRADVITQAQLNKGQFAVEQKDISPILNKLDSIKVRLRKVGREKFDEFQWKFGSTTLSGKVVKWTYGDKLNISLSTDLGNGYTPSFYIIDARRSNRDNANYIDKLKAYINKYQ